jgi:Zinc finger, C2H2 type
MRCNTCGLPALPHKTICPLCDGQNEIHKFVGPHVDKTGKLSRSNTMPSNSAPKPEYKPSSKKSRTNNSNNTPDLSRQSTYHASSNKNSNHNSDTPTSKESASKKNFKCKMCTNFTCNTNSLLQRHIDTVHHGQRLFECTYCKSTFGLKSNLNKHVKAVHEKKRPYSCEHCGFTFTQKSSFTRHLSTIHNINVPSTNVPPENQRESSGSRDRPPPKPPRPNH